MRYPPNGPPDDPTLGILLGLGRGIMRDVGRMGRGIVDFGRGTVTNAVQHPFETALDFSPVGDVKAALYDAPMAFSGGNTLGGMLALASAVPVVPALGKLLPGNAARAVDDLPMDEASRMARAREMGFDVDTPVYHGTHGQDFTEFDNEYIGRRDSGYYGRGHYFADEPGEASSYAMSYGESGYGGPMPDGARVIPAYTRGQMLDLGGSFSARSERPLPGTSVTSDAMNTYRQLRDIMPDDPTVMRVNEIIDDVQQNAQVAELGGTKPHEARFHATYTPGMTPSEVRRAEELWYGDKNPDYGGSGYTPEESILVNKWREAPTVTARLNNEDEAITYLAWEAANRELDGIGYSTQGVIDNIGRSRFSDAVKGAGYAGVYADGGRVVFDPKNIRSRFARFDPAQSESSNLMAGLMGLLGTGALLRANSGDRER